MKPTLFVAVLALVMASAAPTTASVPTTFTVAEGETLILAGTVTADSILIAGTVQAVGDLSLTADTITLTDTARVHGADGLPGASVVADSATAGDGGAGGSLTLSARVLIIADGAHVQGGSGGAGGNALGTSFAVGGLGGDGGGIYLHAQSASIDAVLLPGAGGDGGHATAQVGPAHGGAGGDSGTAYLNGALFLQDIPDVLAPQSSDSKLPLETLPAIHFQPPPKCQQGECPIDDVMGIVEDPCGSLVDGSEGCLDSVDDLPGSPCEGQGTATCLLSLVGIGNESCEQDCEGGGGSPIGFDAGVGEGGAGVAYAVCDLLATACAATAAAVVHQEAKAEGTLPILGPGTVTISADFGIAAVATGVRILLTGEVTGVTSVTSTYEEEKVIKGNDKCQWYNPADWAGNCDPDETVSYHVDKENANGCPNVYATTSNPSLAGDFISGGCSSSAGENVVCMQAEADSSATSNVGNAKPPTASASNCDDEAALNALKLPASFTLQHVNSTEEIRESNRIYGISFRDLPDDAKDQLVTQAQSSVEAIIRDALDANYEGPPGGRAFIEERLVENATSLIIDYAGLAFVTFTPQE